MSDHRPTTDTNPRSNGAWVVGDIAPCTCGEGIIKGPPLIHVTYQDGDTGEITEPPQEDVWIHPGGTYDELIEANRQMIQAVLGPPPQEEPLMPTCASCRFWKQRTTTTPDQGYCRAHPPTPIGMSEDWAMPWPMTGGWEWCGEWEELT